MHARIVKEGAALVALAGRLDDAGRDRLEGILRHEAAACDEGRIIEGRHHSRGFHAAFTELAGNVMMSRFVNELIARQPLLGMRNSGRQSSFSGVIAHTRTLAALLRGDGREAESVNTQLLLALERKFLREGTADPPEERHRDQTSPRSPLTVSGQAARQMLATSQRRAN